MTKINPLDFGKIITVDTRCDIDKDIAIIITIEIIPNNAEEIEILKEALIENIGGVPDEI